MSELYDIYIPVAPKDYNKLKFVIRSIRENLEGYEGIYISTPDDKINKQQFDNFTNIYFFKDRDIFNIDPNRLPFRPGWQYQMMLKMFQNVTKNDYYLTIDSDVYILKKLNMFEDNHPVDFLGWEQYHRPYFEFQERLFGLSRVYPHTFICDMNFFKKSIWLEFLQRFNLTKESFFEKTCEIINPDCKLGEPELYGQYVYKYHPELYRFKKLNTFHEGRMCPINTQSMYSEEDTNFKIEEGKKSGADIMMLHNWTDENYYNWN